MDGSLWCLRHGCGSGRGVNDHNDHHFHLPILSAVFLSDAIQEHAKAHPIERKCIIYLGDYIDRGMESRGVIDLLIRDPLPGFDLHCPLLSLPLAFNTDLETIPGETPYLSADAAKRDGWRDRLGPHDKPRVGLVWAGDPRKQLPNAHLIDRQRSVAFDMLAPLFDVAECTFVNLQKGEDAVRQLRNSPLRHSVIDWSDDFHDFSDTAALVDNLDLVIAVDTSVAHLAGALGKPLWLLNRYNTCWRWLLNRDDSPWYPTAQIFRQNETRNWDSVIVQVRDALRDHVRGW